MSVNWVLRSWCIGSLSDLLLNDDNEIFVWSIKRYSAKKCFENLREIVFPNYLSYTCANDAYSNFIYL